MDLKNEVLKRIVSVKEKDVKENQRIKISLDDITEKIKCVEFRYELNNEDGFGYTWVRTLKDNAAITFYRNRWASNEKNPGMNYMVKYFKTFKACMINYLMRQWDFTRDEIKQAIS